MILKKHNVLWKKFLIETLLMPIVERNKYFKEQFDFIFWKKKKMGI